MPSSKHNAEVQTWLDIIRGQHAAQAFDNLKAGTRPPFPYSDVRLLPYLQHSFWFLPNVAACHAMARLLAERQTRTGTSMRSSLRPALLQALALTLCPPPARPLVAVTKRSPSPYLVAS